MIEASDIPDINAMPARKIINFPVDIYVNGLGANYSNAWFYVNCTHVPRLIDDVVSFWRPAGGQIRFKVVSDDTITLHRL
jgi:hypothetical protein